MNCNCVKSLSKNQKQAPSRSSLNSDLRAVRRWLQLRGSSSREPEGTISRNSDI